jgi:hypothetical protein
MPNTAKRDMIGRCPRKLSVTKWHNRGDYVKNAKQDMTT